jgi:serine/threonine-protein kinase RsbT
MNRPVSAQALPVGSDLDIVRIRKAVRECAVAAGLSLVDQTKLVTAASELARNTLVHGGGGEVTVATEDDERGTTIRLAFSDDGPGIADVEKALTDGFTTNSALGLGLGGARRLVHEFEIDTEPGRGTTVRIGFHAASRRGR